MWAYYGAEMIANEGRSQPEHSHSIGYHSALYRARLKVSEP